MPNYKICLFLMLFSSCSLGDNQNLVGEYEKLEFSENIWFLETGYINDFPATKQGGYFDEENGIIVSDKTFDDSYKSFWYVEDSISVFTEPIDEDMSAFRCCFYDGKKKVELFDVEETSIGSVSISDKYNILAISLASNNFVDGSDEMDFIHLFDLRDLKEGKKNVRKISSGLCAHLRIIEDRIFYSKYHDVNADCLGDYGLYYRDLDDLDKEICVDEAFRFSAISDDGIYILGELDAKNAGNQGSQKSFPFVIWNLKENKPAVVAKTGFYKGIYSRRKRCSYIKNSERELYKISLDKD
ncbi:MAG: hypothetical protein E7077_02940 [Bacteroidales bacterium]|nr:hypothetical protein [Bacteroidales bacterium]